MRDIPLIYELRQITQDVETYTRRTVVVMSAQMGMVPYHLINNQDGTIYLLDLDGLTSPEFMRCSVLSNFSQGSMGTVVSYPVYFQFWDELSSRCHIPKPDVIFDLRTYGSALVEQHGYRVVFEQIGSINSNSPLFHGLNVSADEFIAVREDLLPALHPINPSKLEFSGTRLIPRAGRGWPDTPR